MFFDKHRITISVITSYKFYENKLQAVLILLRIDPLAWSFHVKHVNTGQCETRTTLILIRAEIIFNAATNIKA